MAMYQDEQEAIIAKLEKLKKDYILVKEFSFLNKDIKLFRSPSTGSVSGFVNTEYWTGWYGLEEKQDVKKVFLNICEYLFEYYPVKFIVSGTFDTKEIVEKVVQKQIYFDLITLLKNTNTNTDSLKYTVHSLTKIYSASFLGGWQMFQSVYLFKDNFIDDNIYLLKTAEVCIADQNIEDEILKTLKIFIGE